MRRAAITRADEAVTPVVLLLGVYLAILLGGSRLAEAADVRDVEPWIGLIAIAVATKFTIAIVDRGAWDLGLAIPPRDAARSSLLGIAVAAAVVGSAHLAILATTDARHLAGEGVSLLELLAIFAPAAIHEELLFRGYPFQRLEVWSPRVAIALSAILFGVVHVGNLAVSAIAVANIVLAGIMLTLAYLATRNLWFPISLHLAWNVISGPFLGHEVSGYVPKGTLSRVIDPGPALLTGGEFGLEASLWATAAQLIAVAFLAHRVRRNAVERAAVVD